MIKENKSTRRMRLKRINKLANPEDIPEEEISETKKQEIADIIRGVRTTFDSESCEAKYLGYIYDENNRLIAYHRLYKGLDGTGMYRDWRLIFCAIKEYESANSGRNPTKEFSEKIRKLAQEGLQYIIDNSNCANIIEDTDRTEEEIRKEINLEFDKTLYTESNTFQDYKDLIRDQGESRWAEDLKGIIGDEGYTTIPECKVLT